MQEHYWHLAILGLSVALIVIALVVLGNSQFVNLGLGGVVTSSLALLARRTGPTLNVVDDVLENIPKN